VRDFQRPGRSAAFGERGMVATSHPLASMAAHAVLVEGGTAADAAIAAAGVLCVAEPQMTGVGGDCFWIHASERGEITAYNGSGRSPEAASEAYFVERDIRRLDAWDAHAVTTPGTVDAWSVLHDRHGRTPLQRLLRPAIELAGEGCLVHPRVALDWAYFQEQVARRPESRTAFLPSGQAPKAGERFANPALAVTLAEIAANGRDGFYRGRVADSLVATLRRNGGLHTASDFEAQRGEDVSPVRTVYRDRTVLECPPNGQGLTALIILNILNRFNMAPDALSDADRLHLFAEATKLAYAERNAWCADPRFGNLPVDRLLSASYADQLVSQIADHEARPALTPHRHAHRDTVYLCVVDRDLNCVSFINSLFHGFGSGIFDPETGVLLHNRGLSFCFEPGHPNRYEGRKRPMHTIIPGMVLNPDGRPLMPFGVMGGQYQASGHAQLLSHMFDRGLDPQEACDQPRSFAFDGFLQVENTISAETLTDLTARGHKLQAAPEPIGGAQAIQIDRARGILIGGSDPRKDGLAIGL